MSAPNNILKPPENVKHMVTLDKEQFKKLIEVPQIVIKHAKISDVMPILKPYMLKVEKLRPTIHDDGTTCILLSPILISTWQSFSEADQESLSSLTLCGDDLKRRVIELNYDNYSIEDVFRAVLPQNIEGMASFTVVGHLVHVNLREHLLPYKKLIGQVLYDKIKGCTTVVNKIDVIENTYRNFTMEILHGDENFRVKLKQNGCTYELDFSKVYWNSRLCSEHERIINIVKSNDVLFDIFAGVGPFSIPIAKKGCTVFANDLNPESYKWLRHNTQINKIRDNLKTFNKDGGQFILDELKSELKKYINKQNVHIVMNLPALAVEFLPKFYKLYSKDEISEVINPPKVYVYCFAKGVDSNQLAKQQVQQQFQIDITNKIVNIFRVRTVSNYKEMMRITLNLDEEILLGRNDKHALSDTESSISNKKFCDHGEKQTTKK